MRLALRTIVFCAALGAFATPSLASPITVPFTGVVTSMSGLEPYMSDVDAGDAITGSLTYDLDPSPIWGQTFSGITFSIEDFEMTATNPSGGPGFFFWSGFFAFSISGPLTNASNFNGDYLTVSWNPLDLAAGGTIYAEFMDLNDNTENKRLSASMQFNVPDVTSTFLLFMMVACAAAAHRTRPTIKS